MFAHLLLIAAIFVNVASSAIFEEEEYSEVEDFDYMHPEMRAKWNKQKRNQCKTYDYLTCSPKLRCPNENRRTEKICGNENYVCCARCENLKGYGCQPKDRCSKEGTKGSFYCPHKGQDCCALEKTQLGKPCEENWQCADGNQMCNQETRRCVCKEWYLLRDGKCVEPCLTFNEYFGYKVMVYPKKVSRAQAVATCKSEGARLPVIKNSKLESAINSAVSSAIRTGAPISGDEPMWMGLMPSKIPFNFMWEDNTPLAVKSADGSAVDGKSFTNFNEGRSYDNALGEDCFVLWSSSRAWEDIECGRKNEVMTVCECMPKPK